ncbi:MAG: hypothetical protein HQL87_00695 [Magnetococcales bacterium]|nr:hypothetical protein [Magnetococcales bacterium]
MTADHATDPADEDDTTRALDEDDTTRVEVGIEQQLAGRTPHDAVFFLIKALYQKQDFMDLLANQDQHIVVIDPTCRVVFKPDQFKISRRDIDTQGRPSTTGSYKQFAYAEQFERYKQQKLTEDFREYQSLNNKLMLELSRVTLTDLMDFASKACLETIQHTTEAQAKQLVYPHLYKLFVLVSKYKEQPIPFYSDPS